MPHDLRPDVEVLFREAHRRRRRRWISGAIVVALVLAVAGVVLGANGGGRGGGSNRAQSGPRGAARVAPVSQTAPAGSGVVGRGPTAIDFSDPNNGWIASGGVGLPLDNPTIMHTTDGGQTWRRTSVPNLAAQPIDWQTNRAFGGLVGIHFVDPLRGWFFQSGIAWQTNDGGSRWNKVQFPLNGALVALTTLDGDVWALVDFCPVHAVSCQQIFGKGALYHATSAPTLRWHRVGSSLPAGDGELYPSADHAVVVSLGRHIFRRSIGNRSRSTSTNCESEGALSGGRLAGLCSGTGVGDAAVAISGDAGSTWHHLANGPPPSRYFGWLLTTNGVNTIFYVTGEQTLWRLTAGSMWQKVLHAPSGSDDLIAPVYVSGTHGYALVSNGLRGQWYETKDDGLNWEPVALP